MNNNSSNFCLSGTAFSCYCRFGRIPKTNLLGIVEESLLRAGHPQQHQNTERQTIKKLYACKCQGWNIFCKPLASSFCAEQQRCIIIIKRRFVRRRNMSVDITRAPYRKKWQRHSRQLNWHYSQKIWLYEQVSFQALFELVQCWRALNVIRETVPSSWGCDDERTLAELQTCARDEERAVSSGT